MKRLTYILLVCVVVAAAIGAKATTARTSNEKLQVTQPDQLDLYIERLEFAESSGRENIKVLDSNGKYSYGCLQWQEESWIRYSQKYGIEADIMDCAAQKRLTRQVLLGERNGWRNWSTSVSKLGLPPV